MYVLCAMNHMHAGDIWCWGYRLFLMHTQSRSILTAHRRQQTPLAGMCASLCRGQPGCESKSTPHFLCHAFSQLLAASGGNGPQPHHSLPWPPYMAQKAAPTQTAPPTMLPSVTGRRFFRRKAFQLTDAPLMMPSGMMNILATECSRPSATNAEMQNQMETILPATSFEKEARYTAMHTSQLHRMPRTNAAEKERDVLATATGTEAPPPTRVPPTKTREARSSEPTRLPAYELTQDLMSWAGVAFFSITAMVTRAVFPVKSSAPESSVIISPNGRPNAPRIIFCSPGLVAAKPGQAPPTESMRKAPNPMWQPERMPSPKILSAGREAFFTPAATAPSKPACGGATSAASATMDAPPRGRRRAGRMDACWANMCGFSSSACVAARPANTVV
mmetsp:Transcript_22570/g.51015  ORF Transcript_22570/g.51015 Transcript_22570/m.51015 type:complete len:390 (+) Transcript_22570:208-1377(+)